MAACKIETGGVYANANEFLAREVLSITPDGYVLYNDYGLSDGAPIGRACRCSLGAFAAWAARPLTPAEDRALRREEGEARDAATLMRLTELGLRAASDESIRREFYRRGLDKVSDLGQPLRPGGASSEPTGADIGKSDGTRTKRPKRHTTD
jgi:hypothetical protein